jgi:TfoX/Sxy family transcriptional regulator of competence genes
MAYRIEIENQIRKVINGWSGIETKKMFGGIGFMMNGNMLTGAYKEQLILRLSEKDYQEVIKFPFADPFGITGRPMKGWALLDGQRLKPDDYKYWIEKARDFVVTLPIKK